MRLFDLTLKLSYGGIPKLLVSATYAGTATELVTRLILRSWAKFKFHPEMLSL